VYKGGRLLYQDNMICAQVLDGRRGISEYFCASDVLEFIVILAFMFQRWNQSTWTLGQQNSLP